MAGNVKKEIVERCDPTAMRLCTSLDDRTHPEANTRRAGFDVLVVTTFDTGSMKWCGVVYRTSSKDRGVLINHCPFCGVDFSPAHTGIPIPDESGEPLTGEDAPLARVGVKGVDRGRTEVESSARRPHR